MMRKVSFQAVMAVTAFSVSAVFAPLRAQDAEWQIKYCLFCIVVGFNDQYQPPTFPLEPI